VSVCVFCGSSPGAHPDYGTAARELGTVLARAGERVVYGGASTLHERKARMAELADAFVALPGGAGTLEELFEVYTWGQLGLHDKPIALVNVRGYWDGLLAFLDHSLEEGFVRPEHRARLTVADGPEAVLDAVRR
jgi:uncharacterized protein (TIGR00730 family)